MYRTAGRVCSNFQQHLLKQRLKATGEADPQDYANKARATTESGSQGFLSVLLQPRQARGREDGNDPQSHFIPMGFLAVAGCMLLATAMSAALTSKPSNA